VINNKKIMTYLYLFDIKAMEIQKTKEIKSDAPGYKTRG